MQTRFVPVTCPSCFETFEIVAPALGELPADLDYDCEVCCRPMIIHLEGDENDIFGEARSLDE